MLNITAIVYQHHVIVYGLDVKYYSDGDLAYYPHTLFERCFRFKDGYVILN